MPRPKVEMLRRASLIDATIAEIGAKGTLEVKVSSIAQRAGVSSALAHHYFGHKDALFLAAMRHILKSYANSVRTELAVARTPTDRLRALIRANFTPDQFAPEVIAAWLNFYVLAQKSADARRLLRAYQRRLHSNLVADLRLLIGDRAPTAALGIAAMIDGHYLRHALRDAAPDAGAVTDITLAYLDAILAGRPPGPDAALETHFPELSA